MDLAQELIHRVVIQSKTSVRNSDGFNIDTWGNNKEIWAKITPKSMRDVLAAQALQAKTIALMKVRYEADITTDMRVIHRGCIYAIDSAEQADAGSGLVYKTFNISGGVEKYVG